MHVLGRILVVVAVAALIAWAVYMVGGLGGHPGGIPAPTAKGHGTPPAMQKGMKAAMTEPIVGTAANFDSEVIKSSSPVVVDFWASWCGPCRMVSPILDELAGEFAGRVKLVKVNIDEQPDLARKYQAQAIPTIVFFRKGNVVEKIVGAEPKASLAARFEKLATGA